MALILRFKLATIGARGMKIVGGAMQSTFRFEARELAGTTPKICKTPEKVPPSGWKKWVLVQHPNIVVDDDDLGAKDNGEAELAEQMEAGNSGEAAEVVPSNPTSPENTRTFMRVGLGSLIYNPRVNQPIVLGVRNFSKKKKNSGQGSKTPTIPKNPFPDKPLFKCEQCWLYPRPEKGTEEDIENEKRTDEDFEKEKGPDEDIYEETREIFSHAWQVANHCKNKHKSKKTCNKCGNGFETQAHLRDHMKVCPHKIWEDCNNAM